MGFAVDQPHGAGKVFTVRGNEEILYFRRCDLFMMSSNGMIQANKSSPSPSIQQAWGSRMRVCSDGER